MSIDLAPVRYEFDHGKTFHEASPKAYARVLFDALRQCDLSHAVRRIRSGLAVYHPYPGCRFAMARRRLVKHYSLDLLHWFASDLLPTHRALQIMPKKRHRPSKRPFLKSFYSIES
jgi:hypothetical protein